jgi:hypothetical protein
MGIIGNPDLSPEGVAIVRAWQEFFSSEQGAPWRKMWGEMPFWMHDEMARIAVETIKPEGGE